jgi:hypothetical protein
MVVTEDWDPQRSPRPLVPPLLDRRRRVLFRPRYFIFIVGRLDVWGLVSTEMLILFSIAARADLFPACAKALIFNPMADDLLVLQWR